MTGYRCIELASYADRLLRKYASCAAPPALDLVLPQLMSGGEVTG